MNKEVKYVVSVILSVGLVVLLILSMYKLHDCKMIERGFEWVPPVEGYWKKVER